MAGKPLLVVVTGPTASGKSDLALELAQHLGTEIISADSRQIYKDLPIVTAAPTQEQLSLVTHHLVGCFPLDAYYSASSFTRDALNILPGVFEKNGCCVVCGGSMMYIDALLGNIDDIPTISPEVRARVNDIAAQPHGLDRLLDILRTHDPEGLRQIDKKNLRRVAHAVEIFLQAGVPASSLLTGKKAERPFDVVMLTPEVTREQLFERINIRVAKMREQGMEQEVRAVYHLKGLNSLNTVGVKEWFTYFDWQNGIHAPSLIPSSDDALRTVDGVCQRIAKNTRVYAKKQILWMRRYPDIQVLTHSQIPDLVTLLNQQLRNSL